MRDSNSDADGHFGLASSEPSALSAVYCAIGVVDSASALIQVEVCFVKGVDAIPVGSAMRFGPIKSLPLVLRGQRTGFARTISIEALYERRWH